MGEERGGDDRGAPCHRYPVACVGPRGGVGDGGANLFRDKIRDKLLFIEGYGIFVTTNCSDNYLFFCRD